MTRSGISLNDAWLLMVIGAGFVFTAASFVYTWRVQGMVTKSKDAGLDAISKAKDDALDAVSNHNQTIQKTMSGFMTRAERLINELRNDSAAGRAQIQREMSDHALEDSRTFATKVELSEALGELRHELRAINGKLDRVIERNNQVDRP